MDEIGTGTIFSKIVIAIFLVALADLVFINWWVLNKNNSATSVVEIPRSTNSDSSTTNPSTSPTPIKPIETTGKSSDKNSASLEQAQSAPTPSPSPTTTTVIQTANKEIFIPMGSGETKGGEFTDLSGVEIKVDSSKYSNIDYVVFEASVWVEGGNGRAWAQVKNVDDNNAFIESQITNPTSTPTLKSSGKIPIPSGTKTYRVQAKTDLVDFAAHVDNAHLKIVLK